MGWAIICLDFLLQIVPVDRGTSSTPAPPRILADLEPECGQRCQRCLGRLTLAAGSS